MNAILQDLKKINELCISHNVAKLYAFGSVVKDALRPDSDIDFVVSFKNVDLNEYADNYFDLKFGLQDLLRHKIDLLEEQAIRNPYFREEIDASKQLVYG
ncbi:MAG: nucleotidyltransferase domain-containing protein [Fibrobacterota bacterium]